MLRKGSVVTCQLGLFGDKGFRKSVPVTIIDIKVGKHQAKEYWVRVLGLCVVAVARVPKNFKPKTDLYAGKGNFVGYAGQVPSEKNVESDTDALAFLGYQFE